MKCNTFYEDQSGTSCFKSEGTKNTECPSYMSPPEIEPGRPSFPACRSKVPFLLTFCVPNLGSQTQNMTSLAS